MQRFSLKDIELREKKTEYFWSEKYCSFKHESK